MCGIFGLITTSSSKIDKDRMFRTTSLLFKYSEKRGKDASGISIITKGGINTLKKPERAEKLIKSDLYKNLWPEDVSETTIFGHTRLATNGSKYNDENNQPIETKNFIMIHNGIITNLEKIHNVLGLEKNNFSDSFLLILLLEKYFQESRNLIKAINIVISIIEGSYSVALFHKSTSQTYLFSNTGSLYYVLDKINSFFIFASEKYFLKRATQLHRSSFSQSSIFQVCNKKLVFLTKNKNQIRIFKKNQVTNHGKNTHAQKASANFIKESIGIEYKGSNQQNINNRLSVLRKHIFDYSKIASITRCRKCILPASMPFIRFNKDGVCNYCENYHKTKYLGYRKLVQNIEIYKKNNSKPNCILALSGGRDSAYGLHYVKRVLKMNPVAFTYDWGMITDVGRRNQARMVGKLGVEHFIVSADIDKKRRYIKENILAWINKPEIGMVPLLMEGDKQCVYYVQKLQKQTGIDLVIYCRGNSLENEEFKWGYCGIQNGSPNGVIHDLSLNGKIKMLLYYGRNYLTNPSYFNSSIYDTLFAYFSTYMIKHNFLYLWHYIPWKEKEIINTLTKNYGWENDKESDSTWRIDDGSSAFYNYIYMNIQGFTENDTFRSNQIREGLLTRNEAISLTKRENKPRYEALKWYFDVLGLNGDSILSTIDSLPKKY